MEINKDNRPFLTVLELHKTITELEASEPEEGTSDYLELQLSKIQMAKYEIELNKIITLIGGDTND